MHIFGCVRLHACTMCYLNEYLYMKVYNTVYNNIYILFLYIGLDQRCIQKAYTIPNGH